mmetsp:Transcript_85261/g.227965  ORF Transcript_85261/g.227965 Transcript_85261/m.227965 type:complete len:88 (+) Transcript_85261:1088-1351(+)
MVDQGFLALGNQPNHISDARADIGGLGGAVVCQCEHGRWLLSGLGTVVESLPSDGYLRRVNGFGSQAGPISFAGGRMRESSSLGEMY